MEVLLLLLLAQVRIVLLLSRLAESVEVEVVLLRALFEDLLEGFGVGVVGWLAVEVLRLVLWILRKVLGWFGLLLGRRSFLCRREEGVGWFAPVDPLVYLGSVMNCSWC